MNVTRYPHSLTSGYANVCEIKRFNSMETLYKFMSTGDNSLRWQMRVDLNLPSGRYRTQIDSKTIRYINIKTDRVYSFVR
jgi:hypothetical protein